MALSGTRGPAGQIQIVVCTTVTTRVRRGRKLVKGTQKRCTSRLVSSPGRFASARGARASVSRRGIVYAAGVVTHAGLVLLARRPLAAGRYALTLTLNRAGHTTTISETLTIG